MGVKMRRDPIFVEIAAAAAAAAAAEADDAATDAVEVVIGVVAEDMAVEEGDCCEAPDDATATNGEEDEVDAGGPAMAAVTVITGLRTPRDDADVVGGMQVDDCARFSNC